MKRRNFLRNASMVSAGTLVLPTIINSCVKGANDKITIGLIGTGSHLFTWNLKNYLKLNDTCHIVAVCDVDGHRMDKARDTINDSYGGRGVKRYGDFRELLQRSDIDAVQITTPDHWHAYMTIAALKAGKHVCCEKPTLTVKQGKILVDVVNKQDKLYQTSMEDRWLKTYYRLVELVREGKIGQLKHMRIGLPGGSKLRANTDTTIQKPPKYFNYDMWLGPAPKVPYRPASCHYNFRWNFNYSGGSLTDWGAHLIDTAQLCNFSEKSGPVSVEGSGVRHTGILNTFKQYNLKYVYENGVEMDVHSKSVEIYVEGTDGWLHVNRWNKPLKASNPELLKTAENAIYRKAGHLNEHDDFLQCIRNGGKPGHPVEDMHRTATVGHIGNISMLLKRKLQWDPVNEKFLNDDEANSMLSKPERAPWTLESLL